MDEKDEDVKVCAVCGYFLEVSVDATVFPEKYFHFRSDQQDHVPVAVDPASMIFNQRCDFCDQTDAGFIVLADTFRMTDAMGGQTSVGHWAACEVCADLIRRDRWSALVTRVRNSHRTIARTVPRSVLGEGYALLQRHMHGVITVQEWKERNHYRQT